MCPSHRSRLLLAVFYCALAFAGCGDDDEEELGPAGGECAPETAIGLTCAVGNAYWTLVSVDSDRPRPLPSGDSTTNWLEFRLECFADAELGITNFGTIGGDTTNAGMRIRGETAECIDFRDSGFQTIDTPDYLQTAEAFFGAKVSQFFYGYDPPGAVTQTTVEQWRDIELAERERIRYTVDKVIDGREYVVDVELDYSRPF